MFFCAQAQPMREMRAVWLTTFSNIDWPQRSAPVENQKASLIRILDDIKWAGFNTVFLQVRSQCDAMYHSTIEPWSADLTGKQGVAPADGWDPLEFAVTEAHKRALEIHAWINPYRAVANISALPYFSPEHIALKKPEWLLSSGTLRTLDPGIPEVRNYIKQVISDIVRRYDIDGVHFDDYFYPEGSFNDNNTFARYPQGFTDKNNWRRNNVNQLIAGCNDTIKQLKPWVKFGISPTGIYQNSKDPKVGTPTTGKQHFSELYCDSRLWLQMHWIDYLLPQVYWYGTQPGSPFNVITPWWNKQAGDRHIYIGLAGYKVGVEQGWGSNREIPNQIRLVREENMNGLKGMSVYNTKSLLQNKLGFRDSIQQAFSRPAVPPLMEWIDNLPPSSLNNVNVSKEEGNESGYVLSWDKIAPHFSEMDKPVGVGVYYSEGIPDSAHAIFVGMYNARNGQTSARFVIPQAQAGTPIYFFATAFDRLFNESRLQPAEIKFVQNPPVAVKKAELPKPVPVAEKEKRMDSVIIAKTQPTQPRVSAQPSINDSLLLAKTTPVATPVSKPVQTPDSATEANPAPKKIVKEPIESKPEIVTSTSLTLAKNPGLVRSSDGVRLLIQATGIIEYTLFNAQGEKMTWGKIKSKTESVYVMLPSTQGIAAGEYLLQLAHEGRKEQLILRVLK